MNDRKKLIGVLDDALDSVHHGALLHTVEKIADHLISNGVTVQKWIPVGERLPEDDLPKDTKRKMIRCLVYTNRGTVKPCVRQRWEHFDGEMQPWMWNKDLYAKPTHWMPLPEPPKECE